MPIIKSAKKKLKQDRKREGQNLLVKKELKKIIKEFKKNPTSPVLSKLYSTIDEAVKKKIYHKNKGARLKSRLSQLLSVKKEKKPASTSKKVSPKKN
jgi:small subunit ribosomal protein S20